MDEAKSSKILTKILTKRFCNVILHYFIYFKICTTIVPLSQHTVTLNFHYNLLFRNSINASQYRTLAHQILQGNVHWLIDAFDDTDSKLYGYLVLIH